MTASLTVTQLLQLYAPLAGLLAVVFWLGVLSQKVKNLESDIAGLQKDQDDGSDDHDLLIGLKTTMEAMSKRLDSFDRSMQGVQRTLGNMMIKGGASFEHGAPG